MILVSRQGGLIRLARLEHNILTDYRLWRPDAPDGVGDRYTGRITARVSALGGSFVDLGGTTGFLPDSAGGKTLTEGDMVAVAVTRSAQGGKGPRLGRTDDPIASKPGLHAPGPGPIADFLALEPATSIRADDFELVARLRPTCPTIAHAAHCFAPIEDEIAALADPVAILPHGASATITPTPALVAIDIDAGAASAARGAKSASQAQLNRAIIPALARQIRLRNLGGAILVDFAGMKAAARKSLAPDLTSALATDPLHPRLLGFTALGFAEILRPRIHPPLHEMLS